MFNQKISIIGAGRSGVAAARMVKENGASVFVSDSAPEEKKTDEMEILKAANIEYEFGGHSDRVLDADIVIVSPGIPRQGELFQKLAAKNIPVFSELEVASWVIRAPIVAVTGTNGKTTTTTLIGEIMKHSGRQTVVAGNIGTALSERAQEPADAFVVEVSSFQAEGMNLFRPQVGVLLNLSPDHMDRHPDEASYYRAKRKMLENQESSDWMVYNHDDPRVQSLIDGLSGQPMPFSLTTELPVGVFVKNDVLTVSNPRGVHEIIGIDRIGIRGRHNLANAAAAAAAASCFEIAPSVIAETLHQFRGVEHRLEFVRDLRGVSFYNDSKATNVDSARYALEAFDGKRILWIAGGKHKGAPYTSLERLVEDRVKQMFLIGEAAGLIEHDLGAKAPARSCGSLKLAVTDAFKAANPGDVVLLSPACASFDMFKDYEDRGRQFKQMVNELS
jgi:UDP-N-acetylmuramoylalanine--D-glutamate ligase